MGNPIGSLGPNHPRNIVRSANLLRIAGVVELVAVRLPRMPPTQSKNEFAHALGLFTLAPPIIHQCTGSKQMEPTSKIDGNNALALAKLTDTRETLGAGTYNRPVSASENRTKTVSTVIQFSWRCKRCQGSRDLVCRLANPTPVQKNESCSNISIIVLYSQPMVSLLSFL